MIPHVSLVYWPEKDDLRVMDCVKIHLDTLVRRKIITFTAVSVKLKMDEMIRQMDSSDLTIVMVSADFIASDEGAQVLDHLQRRLWTNAMLCVVRATIIDDLNFQHRFPESGSFMEQVSIHCEWCGERKGEDLDSVTIQFIKELRALLPK